MTVSLGVAWLACQDRDRLTGDPVQVICALVDEADDRIYGAKRAGRNQVMLPAAD